MATLTRDRQYNFRVNTEMLEEAKRILESKNISVPDALNLFVERVVEEKDLPIKTTEQIRAESFLNELISELDAGYQDVLVGRTKPANEVFSKYGL
ncbi:TPA: type II toxin-antitoxin system RelB/DinJ family antitoxin [Streptococcus equi subsp. zooepidemicus]|uniref:type II toxin-antitoxin system RelB/ParD family antitoxin n=1 Tax=Streptococcus equi TaxID=1336 RepID=UPI0005B6F372|nr:type II toxin-antitoxin system RelB/DinJ family antitoxin [Streptococcus equi]KIQ76633.1 acyl-ACP desaturase [Streptococcus equi subsp. zooepidemicus]KIS09947.1 plasmid stabilization system, antitoxin protein [Streptococcus equi subsp. zooepidemicus Sz57]MCD3376680.1 type II toxin-antitoxin system RelB/DinJ family antitoxin [Streptococcus equi subsp. zooepidemicus]MCD3423809.1 type II toxin-antitoxin system RelB/DinJ family antitoxin [Streptococcus equi subsp. zooepidemicus]MCD3436605.1 typ